MFLPRKFIKANCDILSMGGCFSEKVFSNLTPYILGYLAFVEFYLAVRDTRFRGVLVRAHFFILNVRAFC